MSNLVDDCCIFIDNCFCKDRSRPVPTGLICKIVDALCKMFDALCKIVGALCKIVGALCKMFDALCKIVGALCKMFDALCKMFDVYFCRDRSRPVLTVVLCGQVATCPYGCVTMIGLDLAIWLLLQGLYFCVVHNL